jgi:hypothetical protein
MEHGVHHFTLMERSFARGAVRASIRGQFGLACGARINPRSKTRG